MLKIIFALSVFLVCFDVVGQPLNREKALSEIKDLSSRIEKLERDVAIQDKVVQVSIETNDKRLSDYGTLATKQGNQATWIGTLVTIIVAAAGALTYFSVTARARDEAKHVVEDWFKEKELEINQKLASFEQRIENATHNISSHELAVEELRRRATSNIESTEKSLRKAADSVMNRSASTSGVKSKEETTVEVISRANEELKLKPESEFSANEHYIRGVSYFSGGNFQAALDSFNEAIARSSSVTKDELATYEYSRALALAKQGNTDDAIKAYQEVEEKYQNSSESELVLKVANSMNNRGIILARILSYSEAIKLFETLVEKYTDSKDKRVQEIWLKALFNKGLAQEKSGRTRESIVTYEQVAQRCHGRKGLTYLDFLTRARFNIGDQHLKLGEINEAIAEFDNVIAIAEGNENLRIKKQSIHAAIAKSSALRTSGKENLAIETLRELNEKYLSDPSPEIHELLVHALWLKISALKKNGRLEEAADEEKIIIQRYAVSEHSGIRAEVVRGLLEDARELSNRGRFEEVIEAIESVRQQFGEDSGEGVQHFLSSSLNNLGYAKLMIAKKKWEDDVDRAQNLAEAEKIFSEAAQICTISDKGIVFGNLGYVNFLSGELVSAAEHTRKALELGGFDVMLGQRNDAATYSVDVDRDYLDLLENQWVLVEPRSIHNDKKKFDA